MAHGVVKCKGRASSLQLASRRKGSIVSNRALESVPSRDQLPEIRAQGGGVTGPSRFEYPTNPNQVSTQHGTLVVTHPDSFLSTPVGSLYGDPFFEEPFF